MNVIDKIWGNFSNDGDDQKKNNQLVTSPRVSSENTPKKGHLAVQLVNSKNRRARNEETFGISQPNETAYNSEEAKMNTTHTAVFLQHSASSQPNS